MNVTFYQCTAGNFWNSSTPSLDGDTSCKLCTDTALGDIEVRVSGEARGAAVHCPYVYWCDVLRIAQ